MNREIKFRAWHKKYKEMYEVTHIDWEAEFVWVKYYDDDREEWFSREEHFVDLELMQYIGRKDENDDCIFQEDIASVIIQRHVFGFYQETEYVGIVKYDEKECVYYLDLLKKPIESGETIPDEIDGISISSEADEELERFYFNENIDEVDINILGNVYDNPELLND